MLTHLMPVRSPLPISAIWAGLRTMVSRNATEEARRTVESVLGGGSDRSILLLDSGTSALQVALRDQTPGNNGLVAIPAFACYDIATAIDGAQVRFTFYDVDPGTLGPDLGSLRRALVAGADRILVVHLFGIPVDVAAIRSLAEEFGASIVEDAAQGTGGTWSGRPLGHSGSTGILSFGRGKGMTAGGGGALIGNDEAGRALVERARGKIEPPAGRGVRSSLALCAQWLLARRSLYWIPSSLPFLGLGETPYHAASPPREISSFSLGVLRCTSRLVEEESAIRRAHARRLLGRLNARRFTTVSVLPGGVAGFLRLPLLTSTAPSPDEIARMRSLGIARGYPTSLADLEGFGARASGRLSELPGARTLAERLITIPVHGALTEADLLRLETWLAA
jgi:perosamine synthetase